MNGRWLAGLLLVLALRLPAYYTHGHARPRYVPGACRSAPAPAMAVGGDEHDDWRSFRARLVQGSRVASSPPEESGRLTLVSTPPSPPPPATGADGSFWVHELAVPEPGCLLLAQPHALLVEQPILHRAVVLVLEHDEKRGTVGLLLDTPADATLGDLLKRRGDSRLRALAANRLMIGGTVLSRERYLLIY